MKQKIFILISLIFFSHTLSRADVPQWSVDASKYEFSMTITSAIYINGSFISGEDVMLAARVGDEVRGVTSSVYDQYHDRWLFFLTIFSNQFSGEKVSFMFYDPIADDVTNLWNETDFASATNQGSISNPYVFFAEQPSGKSSVIFQVEDENGQTISDAVVVFHGVELGAGTYLVEDIVPGSYSWSVARQGYITSTGEVTVGAETPMVVINVTLQLLPEDPGAKTFEIFFSVTDLYGNLLEGVEVLLNDDVFAGNQVIAGVESGQYSFKVSKSGYITREGQITITSSNMYMDIILLEQSTNTFNAESVAIRMYPNPAARFVVIDAPQSSGISAIEVYNTSGRLVIHTKGFGSGDKIDISPLAKGVYLCTIVLQNGDRIVEKLVIK